MTKVLVTGGAGFVGSHLTQRLLDAGHDVVVIDNFSTGQQRNLQPQDRLQVIEQDVCKPWDIPVSAIYHLACPASPVHYQADPIQTLDTNYLGTRNALEQAQKHGASLLFSSTSEVYGDPNLSPQPESYWGNVNSYGIRSCYDEGKRVAEALCHDYAGSRGVRVRVARIFNTYGPQMAIDDGRVVSNFIVQALQGQALSVYGEGQQTRSLCYVDDLVEGLLRLMQAPGGNLEHPCNLGNPFEQTVLEIAQMVLEITGSSSEIQHHPLPKDDPRQRCPDIARAKQWLDWEPKVSARDGLKRTVDYFQGLLQAR